MIQETTVESVSSKGIDRGGLSADRSLARI